MARTVILSDSGKWVTLLRFEWEWGIEAVKLFFVLTDQCRLEGIAKRHYFDNSQLCFFATYQGIGCNHF